MTLPEESVTTVADEDREGAFFGELIYSELIDASQIRVTLNGNEYICTNTSTFDGSYTFGALWNEETQSVDWSEYPFIIWSYTSLLPGESQEIVNEMETEGAGTYQVKIEAFEESVETSECFDKARGYSCTEEWVTLTDESVTTTHPEGAPEGIYDASLSIPSYTVFGETIRVTYDGVQYMCQENVGDWGAQYDISLSRYDWSDYPFSIFLGGGDSYEISTSTGGTHSVKVENLAESIETSECFAKAVNKVVEIPQPTASLSKATFTFVEEGEHEVSGTPTDYTRGDLLGAPTLTEMRDNISTTEYYASYNSLRMPLTYIDSSKAQFTAFEQVRVQSTDYIRHHIITYDSGGSARWDRYDIAVPTSY